tara:strand:+ start:9593 stop:10105 length:513 start_codon:yes stop_codon:yes gene_type:complete
MQFDKSNIDIKINRDSRDYTPESKDTESRKELLWESREEQLLLKWCDDCEIRSTNHEIKSKKNKVKFIIFQLPAIILPIVLSGLSPLISCDSLFYSLAMMSIGLISGIGMFFNFGKKSQTHGDYSNKFFEIKTEINTELSKPKSYRIACDVYLEKTKQQYNNLVKTSPTL